MARLSITRVELVAAVRTNQVNQLIKRKLRAIGLSDCTECAERLLRNVDRLLPKLRRTRS